MGGDKRRNSPATPLFRAFLKADDDEYGWILEEDTPQLSNHTRLALTSYPD